MMRLKLIVLLSCLCLLALPLGGSCSKQPKIYSWPPAVVVPVPSPCPWADVAAYTEATYHLDVTVGEEFAVGMFEREPGDPAREFSRDPQYFELLRYTTIPYSPPILNQYGTQWFLYKATKIGNAELMFSSPIWYNKSFYITIKA